MRDVVLGVDIGTGSSKGVLVDAGGRVVATAVREHRMATPRCCPPLRVQTVAPLRFLTSVA
jgi:sugar (pentulose or hexulose) kinase